MIASCGGHLEVVHRLLAAGSNVNAADVVSGGSLVCNSRGVFGVLYSYGYLGIGWHVS